MIVKSPSSFPIFLTNFSILLPSNGKITHCSQVPYFPLALEEPSPVIQTHVFLWSITLQSRHCSRCHCIQTYSCCYKHTFLIIPYLNLYSLWIHWHSSNPYNVLFQQEKCRTNAEQTLYYLCDWLGSLSSYCRAVSLHTVILFMLRYLGQLGSIVELCRLQIRQECAPLAGLSSNNASAFSH